MVARKYYLFDAIIIENEREGAGYHLLALQKKLYDRENFCSRINSNDLSVRCYHSQPSGC